MYIKLKFIDSLDFLGLVETWTHQDSPISLPGYKYFRQPAKKLKIRGRMSGWSQVDEPI